MRAKLVIAGFLLALSAGGAWWFLPQGTKLSDTDSLLLAEFANTTGDPVFNSSLREALAVSLALSSEYFLTGDYDQAAVFAQQALRIDPGSAAWYENLFTAYIALMRLDDAQNILNQAVARKLDDSSMHRDLYSLAFLRGDSAGMEREMAWSVGKPGGEDDLLALQADTEVYLGHVQKAGNFRAAPWSPRKTHS
jgi:tetratricopeptide (TPR) repeat protein